MAGATTSCHGTSDSYLVSGYVSYTTLGLEKLNPWLEADKQYRSHWIRLCDTHERRNPTVPTDGTQSDVLVYSSEWAAGFRYGGRHHVRIRVPG